MPSLRKLIHYILAFISLLVSLVGFAALVYMGYPMSIVYKKFMKIATAAVIFSYVLSILLYIKSLNISDNETAADSGKTYYLDLIITQINSKI